jgi:glutathione S-transferase
MQLYGHPFSSYTWKALIAFYGCGVPFEFRLVDPSQPGDEGSATVAATSPTGKFPLLVDGGQPVFEATSIVEYLALTRPEARFLLPEEPQAAARMRMIDRVFDNYVMTPMQEIVAAHIRSPGLPDAGTVGRARDVLDRAYPWLDRWLKSYQPDHPVTLIECAAAPSLFYADWTYPIPMQLDRLRQWRAHLLALPAVARCVDEARPYRHYFPPGAPDRD